MFGKFAYLRGNFQRILRKIRNNPKSEPKWEYFKPCSFLLDVYDNTSFDSSSVETTPQEEIVFAAPFEDIIQEDFSPLYSPKSPAASPAPAAESTTSPVAAPYASPESQPPSPQPVVDTPTLRAFVNTPSPQDVTHTPSPQDVVHTPSHQSAGPSTSTLSASVTPRGKKSKLEDSCDTSGKIVQALDHVNSAMNTFLQNKQVNKPGKHDFVISSVQSFLNSFPISDRLKNEFGSKVVLIMHEYMQYYDETQKD